MEILPAILKGLFVLVALVMTFFILLQEGKGGGLAGLGGTKAAGVEGVTNPIRRATAVLAGLFFLLAIVIAILARGPGRESGEGLFQKQGAKDEGEDRTETVVPEPAPAPAPGPVGGPALNPAPKVEPPPVAKVPPAPAGGKAEAPKAEAPAPKAPGTVEPKAAPEAPKAGEKPGPTP